MSQFRQVEEGLKKLLGDDYEKILTTKHPNATQEPVPMQPQNPVPTAPQIDPNFPSILSTTSAPDRHTPASLMSISTMEQNARNLPPLFQTYAVEGEHMAQSVQSPSAAEENACYVPPVAGVKRKATDIVDLTGEDQDSD